MLKKSIRACSFMVIPWWCLHPKPTFLGCPLQHQQFPPHNQHQPDPAGPLQLTPLHRSPCWFRALLALGRVTEVKTKAMQPGAGHQQLLLLGDKLGPQEAEEGRRG